MIFAREYYAWVDAAELLEPGIRQVRLDAFDARAMDALLSDAEPWYTEYRSALHPTVFEATTMQIDMDRLPSMEGYDFVTDHWYKIRLGNAGLPLHAYTGLDEPTGIVARMEDAEPVDGMTREGRLLSKVFSLSQHRPAGERAIRDAFEIRGAQEAHLCVYHVGQGSCAALCDADRTPLVYLDLGGGVTRNAGTYPAGLKLCFSGNQPVILSHWDMDHWVGGKRHPSALASMWLVPDQRMGPTHRAFAQNLAARGNLLKWPDDQDKIVFSWGWITKLPKQRDRNHSGLVVVAHIGDEGLRALIPGDAPYHRIPDQDKANVSLLVATHHGGWYRRDIPPRAVPRGTVFYSYGTDNSYKHPRSGSVQKHEEAGWRVDRVDTPAGHACRPTPAMLPAPPACGGRHCTLTIEQ